MASSRTRIRLGSGGVLYLLVSGVILASAIYTQANLLFWGFGLMVGGMIISVCIAAISLRGLEVTRVVSSHCAAGEALPLGYELHNRSWLPMFSVVLQEGWGSGLAGWKSEGPASGAGIDQMLGGPPQAWVLHVGAGQVTQTQAPCRPRRRGKLTFERIEASTSFPFSVLRKSVTFEQTDEVLVFPYLYRVRRQLLTQLATTEGEGKHVEERPGGTEEFFGLREYRPGDSPRMIDWKRTAKTGELVARELTTPRPPSLSLVLDLRETPPMSVGGKRQTKQGLVEDAVSGRQLEERAVSLAASLICDAYLRGFRVGLRVLGPECPTFRARHSLLHRTQLLEALTEMDLAQKDQNLSGADTLQRTAVVIWPGRGSTPSVGGRGGNGGGPTVLGAADFDRYVTNATDLAALDQATSRNTLAAKRSELSGSLATAAVATARGGE
ncbi:DUF58 domain-containing protein [Algisphaera agarilytica]|uniref:Uncharacterized protein (DUF58 family) n=1 Tax=Algisphaera agarilytica TaxID=1385975 RepID=A0A7X0H753_9BACT|nr:DUF58 domain-containing protein [Algisphaera agarilytica]MBB6430474.1 uncharacterized protein (DUF58 family) [Algisphaera agarilytica]